MWKLAKLYSFLSTFPADWWKGIIPSWRLSSLAYGSLDHAASTEETRRYFLQVLDYMER